MPDPNKLTVSASQAPMLVNHSPYGTRWMLWHYFRYGTKIEPDEDFRMLVGKLIQPVILALTARRYRLQVVENKEEEYARRGSLGATIDGLMIAPDRGRVTVEAKNIDYMRWRDTWSETIAAPHVEIQTQVNMWASESTSGTIAAFIGGNDLRFYERELNRELIDRLEEEARLFLESVRLNKEPDPLGDPMELPLLNLRYPERPETEIYEDLGSDDLALTIRQFARAREDESFNRKLKEQMQARLLSLVGAAGVVRANGYTAFLKSIIQADTICAPHSEARVIRAGSRYVKISVTETAVVEGATAEPVNFLGA